MRFQYLVGLVLLVVDPIVACMPYREHFQFGLDEIEPALEGTWHAAWTRDGQRHTLRFRLRVAGPPRQSAQGLVRSAAACGTRTLVRSASACVTETFISLEVLPLDAAEGTFEAMLYVGGYSFDGGVLNLWLGDREAEASATISAKGAIEYLFDGPALNTSTTTPVVHLESLSHISEGS